jgi:prepilin signal peptidase PulO-like enzyme (type II secretory pathway)
MVDWWWGLAGAAAGLVSFGLLYLIGRAVYRGAEPLAHGDVTIAAMVGAMAGPLVLTALVAGVVFSGLFGLVILALRRSRTATMPYGPGLCLGGLLSLFLTSSA